MTRHCSGGLRARAPRAPHRRHHQRRRDADALLRPALRRARPRADRHRLLVLGVVGLPCRPRIFVHLGDRLDRRGAADQRVARRDGRGLGALRGLHQAADRRGRHRAGLRVRQVLGGHAAPGARAADRPVHASRRCGRTRCRSPACRRGSASTPASGPPSRWPRWRWTRSRSPSAPTRRSPVLEGASTNCWPGRTSPIRCAATTSRRSPTVPRRSCWPRATRPASSARTRPG